MKELLGFWIFTLTFGVWINSVQGLQINKGQWTWVGGNSIGNAHNSVNTTGHQYPGARYGAATWTDKHGNVWMFGGHGQSKPLNELWVFSANTKSWSLKDKGVTNVTRPDPCVHCAACSFKGKAVIFGSVIKRKGKSSGHTWIFDMTKKKWKVLKGRNPSPRVKLSYWCDPIKGKLWIFGGDDGSKIIDDMWEFSFVNMTWGQIDSSKIKPFPEARFSSTTWVHLEKLYLFGGQGDMGLMSDLWVFLPKHTSWQRLKGSANASQAGVYRDLGIPSEISMPGCRRDAASWSVNGDLWMFGGSGCDNTTGRDPGFLSDMWFYNTSRNLWTWMGGLAVSEGHASYGRKGQTKPSNLPGPRESAVHFKLGRNLWLFGGSGHDGKGDDSLLNDLWEFGEAITPPATLGPATHGKGLPGDTLDMSYTHRLLIAIVILTIVMAGTLFLCYRKECNIWCWRVRHRAPKVRYEPIKVKMQVPDV